MNTFWSALSKSFSFIHHFLSNLSSECTVALPSIHRGETESYVLKISLNGEDGGLEQSGREADKSFVQQRCSCWLYVFVFISGATAAHESAPAANCE